MPGELIYGAGTSLHRQTIIAAQTTPVSGSTGRWAMRQGNAPRRVRRRKIDGA
jgi:hypothetical protein